MGMDIANGGCFKFFFAMQITSIEKYNHQNDNGFYKEENVNLTMQVADMQKRMDDKDEAHVKLTEKNKELQRRLDLFEGKQERVSTLDLDQLLNVKKTMHNSIRIIEEAEQKLMDNIRKCVVCLTNNKCIALNGCGHIALCEQCEAKLQQKKCPICRAQYTKCRKMNL